MWFKTSVKPDKITYFQAFLILRYLWNSETVHWQILNIVHWKIITLFYLKHLNWKVSDGLSKPCLKQQHAQSLIGFDNFDRLPAISGRIWHRNFKIIFLLLRFVNKILLVLCLRFRPSTQSVRLISSLLRRETLFLINHILFG